jgi:hypothetical protein
VKKTLFALAMIAATPACLVDEMPEDSDVGGAELGLVRGYHYEVSGKSTQDTWHDSPNSIQHCQHLSNGVVRGWRLNEVNANDFRWSRVICREMEWSGTISTTGDTIQHFWESGNGDIGGSWVPMNRLPVGVRIRYAYHPFTSPAETLKDVAMLYDSADDIYAGYQGATQAPWAFERNGHSAELRCIPGYVLTGISVSSTHGGRNRREIDGVQLQCGRLAMVSNR